MAKSKAKVGKVLYTKEQIEKRLDELAADIQRRYAGDELTVVAVLKGSLFFTADLVRRLDIPVRMDILEVASYFDGTTPVEDATLASYMVDDVRGRDVLIVDDILDTGRTLSGVLELLKREEPKTVATCVFLRKKRKRDADVSVDFCGFDLRSARFVVGYGLDFAQRFRNLPYLAELDEGEPKKAARRAARPKKKVKKTKKRK